MKQQFLGVARHIGTTVSMYALADGKALACVLNGAQVKKSVEFNSRAAMRQWVNAQRNAS